MTNLERDTNDVTYEMGDYHYQATVTLPNAGTEAEFTISSHGIFNRHY